MLKHCLIHSEQFHVNPVTRCIPRRICGQLFCCYECSVILIFRRYLFLSIKIFLKWKEKVLTMFPIVVEALASISLSVLVPDTQRTRGSWAQTLT